MGSFPPLPMVVRIRATPAARLADGAVIMCAPNGTSGTRLGAQQARIMGRRLLRRCATRAVDLSRSREAPIVGHEAIEASSDGKLKI